MTYGKMWGLTNVMGNWLRSKNTIQIVGENLYVHAGLSKVFMEREETIPEINELVSKSIYPFIVVPVFFYYVSRFRP